MHMPKAGHMAKNTWEDPKLSTDWSLGLVQAESEGQGRTVNHLNIERVSQHKTKLQNVGEIFFLIPPSPPLLLSFLFIPVFKEICQNSGRIQAKETRTSETTHDEEYRH